MGSTVNLTRVTGQVGLFRHALDSATVTTGLRLVSW
jgi:hypothetical protein